MVNKEYSVQIDDLLIAGLARSKGMILVTNNIGEFDRIDGLRLENCAFNLGTQY
jgi:tRNA(fMet)-specific endonuclease VapC